jgi:thiamine biosynthesis lipoprotein ApbE
MCDATELAERIAVLERMRSELTELAQQARQLPLRADAEFCHIIETARRA